MNKNLLIAGIFGFSIFLVKTSKKSIDNSVITDIIFFIHPTNTVIVEVNTSLGEYKAYISAIIALTKNPKMPAISKFLFIKMVSLYFL